MKYLIKTICSKRFALINEDKEVATLNYKGWSMTKSEIIPINGEIFNLESVSMLKSKFQLKQKGQVILNYEMNWRGHFLIRSKFENVQNNFIFKSKGFWGNTYVLTDEKENQLVEIVPQFSWRGFKTNYVIETTPNFEKMIHNDVLLLILVHCIRYYMTMVAVVM